jgi:lysophospholipid acyltransferase (LPLAT)-like uncharacterized protein
MKLRWDHPLFRRQAPVWAARLFRAYMRTCRTELAGNPEAKDLFLRGAPVVFAMWHCHLLSSLHFAPIYFAHHPPMVLMASPSRDGEFIGEVSRQMGCIVCPGSRHKGGIQALQKMAEYLCRGHGAAIIADGSRGPARVAQKGVIYLAREAQVPLIPVAVASRPKLTFNTWDRFELPLPLGRVALLLAEPLRVDAMARGPRLESLRLELTARLNRVFELSQAYFPPRNIFG